MIYSVASKKTVWKYLNITNPTFFITYFQIHQKQSYELLPDTKISNTNSCHIYDQNTYFSELFRFEWYSGECQIILQRTLIKGKKQGLSARAGNRITSLSH